MKTEIQLQRDVPASGLAQPVRPAQRRAQAAVRPAADEGLAVRPDIKPAAAPVVSEFDKASPVDRRDRA